MQERQTDFWTANMAALKEHHPRQWRVMADTPPEPVGEIFFATGSRPNLKVVSSDGGEIHLHLDDDPEGEVSQFLGMIGDTATDVVVLFGMGLGYTPQAILQQRPYVRHLIIFEAEPGIFIQALQVMDLSRMLADPRLTLCLGPHPDLDQQLQPEVKRAMELENVQMLRHVTSLASQKTVYQDMEARFYDFVRAYKTDANTKIMHGREILRNHIKNVRAIPHHRLLEEMMLHFSGVPAFIVAAGPSLDQNIHLLKDVADKALIICVDSALPALLHHGIRPHFVTILDYSEFTIEKIAPCASQSSGISLITMPLVNPQVPNIFPVEQVFWLFTQSPLSKWINTLLEGTICTGGVGTVAHLNIISAIILGCSPIVFVGQDLSLMALRDHTEHAVISFPDDLDEVVASAATIRVKGIHGDMLPTRQDLYIYKEMFEQIIAGNPGHYINASANGAHIEGTEVMPLERVIALYGGQSLPLAERIAAWTSEGQSPQKQAMFLRGVEQTHQQTIKVQSLIDKVDQLVSVTRTAVDKLMQSAAASPAFAALPVGLKKKIKEMDATQKLIDEATLIWGLLDEVTLAGMLDCDRMRHALAVHKKQTHDCLPWLLERFAFIEQLNRVRSAGLHLLADAIGATLSHCRTEKRYLRAIAQGVDLQENLINLARFYMDEGQHLLARPILSRLLAMAPGLAEGYFHLGCIAAMEMRYAGMEEYFRKALQHDPTLEELIQQKRSSWARHYRRLLAEGESGRDIGSRRTLRTLWLKGYNLCPTDPCIIEGLRENVAADLAEAKSLVDSNGERYTIIINELHKDFERNSGLESCLAKEQLAIFYQLLGRKYLLDAQFPQAISALARAIACEPGDPDNFLFAAQAYLSVDDWEMVMASLKQATAIDQRSATYWEAIGDELHARGDDPHAIAAYEHGYLALPEHHVLLRKMGDCYLAQGQLAAAREAYQQAKAKLEGVGADRGHPHR